MQPKRLVEITEEVPQSSLPFSKSGLVRAHYESEVRKLCKKTTGVGEIRHGLLRYHATSEGYNISRLAR